MAECHCCEKEFEEGEGGECPKCDEQTCFKCMVEHPMGGVHYCKKCMNLRNNNLD